jgi:DNA repair protein RecN (Recombination protein N)
MLKQLYIEDFVLIDRVALEFGPGFTVLSGETGAGKSIIVSATACWCGAARTGRGWRPSSTATPGRRRSSTRKASRATATS